jgi:hypothetical protein
VAKKKEETEKPFSFLRPSGGLLGFEPNKWWATICPVTQDVTTPHVQ